MNKITREEFEFHRCAKDAKYLWSRIQEAQSSEPMSLDKIGRMLQDELKTKFPFKFDRFESEEWIGAILAMAKTVQPLTVQQGFVVDWLKAPEWATEWDGCWFGNVVEDGGRQFKRTWITIPRPTDNTKPKTTGEKRNDLIDAIMNMTSPDEIDELCKVAGIPLETTKG